MLSSKAITERASGRPEIQRLSDALVDQIAAGEVVERPASIVKELVENALDAQAERIRIEVRAGGTALIAVEDNGIGMSPEQLRMAVLRHATSKIHRAEDLDSIGSYGFRGEALPAIGSVSSMRLLTRPRGASSGHELRIDASAITMDREAGCAEGTRIEVAELFARVPARRKFLKQPTTEWGHTIDWLGRLAMAMPGVHFEIQRDDRRAMVWPGTSDPMERIARVLGESQGRSLTRVDWEEGIGHIEAYVSGPEQSRANTAGIHLYVNGRPVRDKLLRNAVMHVYRDLLPRGRFPLAVLFLTVDPTCVDVNVHPAKWEVRFREPQAIHQLIRNALRSGIEGRGYLSSSEPPSASVPSSWSATEISAQSLQKPSYSNETQRGSASDGDWLFADRNRPDSNGPLQGQAFSENRPIKASETPRLNFADQRLLGQVMARYLVLEGEGGLLLVDQHAAHERILYEKLRASWFAGGVSQQGLLIPLTLDLEPQALNTLITSDPTVKRLGFEIEAFGESSIVVRAIPEILAGNNPESLIRDLADELDSESEASASDPSQTRILKSVDRVFATLACHSARRFGDHLPEEEQKAILEGLDTIPWAPTCPHGRPVVARLGIHELDGRFGRR